MSIAVLVLFFPFFFLDAQSVSTSIGARATGMANAASCAGDEWSLFNNAGGIAEIKKTSAGFSYHARPQLPGANRMAVVVASPVRTGTAAVGVYRMGSSLYNEQMISGGYSNKFGLASLGVKVNYIQYNAEGFGSKGVTTISMGGIASLTPTFKVGAHITNINQAKLSGDEEERVPTILTAGISFSPSENVVLCSEIEKDIDHDATLKAAVEYLPLKKFSIRSGINVYPQAVFFGFGFNTRPLRIDYAMDYFHAYGSSHQVSLTFRPFRQ